MGIRLENARRLYLEAIQDGNAAAAINKYAGERYTQHSTPVKDGKAGFIEFFEEFLQRNPVRDIKIVRGFEDGPFVFLHVTQSLNNGEFRYVTADIFETDRDGKMIEHWDMITELVDDTTSGHTQVDGPTEPTDLHKTELNKKLVREFLHEVLQKGNYEKVTDYLSTETYIQHNPQIGDGLAGLSTFVNSLTEQGLSMTYEDIHLVIGSGNFVASLSKMNLGGTEMAVIDLFRVDAGRIVEHWDVMEEIQPADQWVNSGKF
ncbi:MAG: nuclear transport factor 2 family protein [Deltaproteobacteria bacterium]|nr:nuclear transport factor 2 family protein [Deltaproteobacteria bacterium]